MEEIFIGIDGGGTKTEALAAKADGTELAHTIGGSSNPNDIGIRRCLTSLHSIISELGRQIEHSGDSLSAVKSVFAGISGGLAHKTAISGFLAPLFDPQTLIGVGSDADNVVSAGLEGGDGAILISGTGSVCFAEREAYGHGRERRRIGGWGWLLDGAGGGYDIGRDALTLCLRQLDGRSGMLPPFIDARKLTELLTAALRGDPREKLGEIYSDGKARIAGLAPVVMKAASEGESCAGFIVEKSADELASYVRAAADFFGGESFKLVMAGSLLVKDEYFRRLVTGKLPETAKPEILGAAPVEGALQLAVRQYR